MAKMKKLELKDLQATLFGADTPVTDAQQSQLSEAILTLCDRQRQVLECTYGLNGQPRLEQTEIAARLAIFQTDVSYAKKAAIMNLAELLSLPEPEFKKQERGTIEKLRNEANAVFQGLRNNELNPDNYADVERRRQLDNALQSLTTNESLAVELAFGIETGSCYSNREIKKMLGLSDQDTSVFIKRGLKKIIAHMNETCFEVIPESRGQKIPQPLDQLIEDEDQSCFFRAFNKAIKRGEKELLVLEFVHDRTDVQMSRDTQLALGTVKSRSRRGQKKLAAALSA